MFPNRNRGFTLIELLVAVTIMAILSLLAYQLLYQTQISNQVSEKKSNQINALQKAIVVMDNDFRQIADRQFRTNGEQVESKKLVWENGVLGGDGFGLVFTRLGWGNYQWQFPRGEVTKVGYQLYNNQLQRSWWRYPDTVVGDKGNRSTLLNGVSNFGVRFYDNGEWVTSWQKADALPKAVSIQFTLKDYGKIERTYLIASYNQNRSDSE